MTQNNLGLALQRLGEREAGTARFEAAVTAYQEALKERTRDRAPLDWAMTQNNLQRVRGQVTKGAGTGQIREKVKEDANGVGIADAGSLSSKAGQGGLSADLIVR